ncbi:15195_t:CDS:1, partial [Dentiscutata heterogama]
MEDDQKVAFVSEEFGNEDNALTLLTLISSMSSEGYEMPRHAPK